MWFQECLKSMTKMATYFKANIDEDHLKRYFEKLKFIPSNVFDDLLEDWQDKHRATSGNFPTIHDLQLAYNNWREANPDMFTARNEEDYPPCDVCGSTGTVRAWYYHEDMKTWDGTFLRCGHCDRWKKVWGRKSQVKSFTMDLIQDKRWRLDDPLRQDIDSYKKYESIADMADAFGGWPEEEIPF